MENGSLFNIIADPYSPFFFDWVLRVNIALDTAKGMLYLHSRDPPIIHRDIKSLNILVNKDWKAVVCDFGLTRIKSAGDLKTRCGSPAWSAPEVLKGQSYNESADVYRFDIPLHFHRKGYSNGLLT